MHLSKESNHTITHQKGPMGQIKKLNIIYIRKKNGDRILRKYPRFSHASTLRAERENFLIKSNKYLTNKWPRQIFATDASSGKST